PLAGPMPPATLDDYLNLSSSGSYALVLGQNPENGRQVLVFTCSDGTQSIYEFNPVHSFFIETPVQLDLAQIPYTGADREYMEYIREVYTRLPEDTAAAMRQIAAEEGLAASEGIWDWQYLAVRVAKYVQTAARYTQTPGRQPANQDFAAYFLTTGKKGYCMHFATAAVTLLRAFGVPARYTEGYVAPAKAGETEGWLDIPGKNAHAWAEVWVPGMGWLPLEVTPGGADRGRAPVSAPSSSSPASRAASSSRAAASSSSQAMPSASLAGAGSSSNTQYAAEANGNFPPLWAALAAALFLVFAIVFVYYIHYKNRKADFRQKNTRAAVLAIYRYLCRLAAFGYELPGEITELANRAFFSNQAITAQEQALLLALAKTAREQTFSGLRFPQKIWFCLRGL
ncbi:MAG: transglutaminase-like domain-containing protein, partial [Oscillospiraceae bacterium]